MFARTVARVVPIVVAALIAAAVSAAAQTATIAGIWWTPEHDGKIEIVIDATGTASGRVIALSPEDAGKLDVRNPDPALRSRPALGLTFLRGFRQEHDGSWSGGTVYDPANGSTYHGTLRLDGPDRLRMRGYVGISLFGRTEILPRVTGPTPARPQPGEPELVYESR